MNTTRLTAQDPVRPRFVLCDMDGTLVDTEELKSEAWRRAIGEATSEMPPAKSVDQAYSRLVGGVAREMCRAFVDEFQLEVPPHVLYELREKHRVALYEDRERLRALVRDHVVGFLRLLRIGDEVVGGLEFVLVTTAPERQVSVVLESLGVGDLFDQVICGLEKSRTNPACYLAALERLRCAPEECLAIEDSPAGYEAARGVGIPCLLVPNRFTRGRKLHGEQ